MSKLIGVDIGGTNVKIGVIDENYNVIEYIKFKTNKHDIDAMLSDVCVTVNTLKNRFDVESVGVGSPGRICDGRTVTEAGNLPYDNTPVADIIESRTGIKTYLDNDANCALYGEKYAGKGRDVNDLILLTIGTGVGGGIMIGKQCYRGHNNRAGELGHFIIDMNGRPCSCGNRGCLEQYASVTAFVASARKAASENPDSILMQMADGEISNIGGRLPFKAMYRGCEVSKKVIDEYILHLAYGINSLCKIFMPEAFVLTGGLINEGEIITDLLSPYLLPEVNCFISPLFGKAGLIGAALIKKEKEK